MSKELIQLKEKIWQEFHLLRVYAIETDELIKTLHEAEIEMIKKFIENPEAGLLNVNYEFKEGKVHLGKDESFVVKNIINTLSSKQSMTTNYWSILRVSTLVYATSLFDGFFQDLLTALFTAFPKSVTSSKPITHQKVLEFDSIEGLKAHLINENVSEIAYKTIKDQLSFIDQKFHIKLDETYFNYSQTLVEIYETRNIHVHNKGIINSIYLEKVQESKFKSGDVRTIDKDYLINSIEILQIVADELVKGAINKTQKKSS